MHSCRWPVCACGGGEGFDVRAAKATCEGGGGAMWGEAAVGQPGLVSSSKVSSHKTEILRRMRPPLIMQCVNSLLESGCCSREFLVICRSGSKQRALLYLPATIHSLPCCKQQRAFTSIGRAPSRTHCKANVALGAHMSGLPPLPRLFFHPCFTPPPFPPSP